jgi:hypothetical protein
MPTVQLGEIATEDEIATVMGLRRGPGRDHDLGSMISDFEDAIALGGTHTCC